MIGAIAQLLYGVSVMVSYDTPSPRANEGLKKKMNPAPARSASPPAESVSYTHLTLPTILLV